MSQPTPYDRQFNFQNQQLLTPTEPNPGDEMDSEFNAIKLTLDQILANLLLIQRNDGALANQSVARDTLHSSIQLGFGAPTVWHENTRYVADFDTIFHEAFFYKCIETHVSDPSPLGFDNDLAKWELIADFSAAQIEGLGTMSTQNANNVIISGGSIAGTDITVATPDASTKAANKQYVDDAITTLTAYVNAQDVILAGKLSASSGTRLVCQQTSAPTGWTKDTSYNDHALRVTSSSVTSGGVLNFSTVFAKTATDVFTLTTTYIPAHAHGGATASGGADHTHNYAAGFAVSGAQGGAGANACTNSGSTTSGANSYLHGHTIASEGGGGAHQHGMDIRVKYVDTIIATKD